MIMMNDAVGDDNDDGIKDTCSSNICNGDEVDVL